MGHRRSKTPQKRSAEEAEIKPLGKPPPKMEINIVSNF